MGENLDNLSQNASFILYPVLAKLKQAIKNTAEVTIYLPCVDVEAFNQGTGGNSSLSSSLPPLQILSVAFMSGERYKKIREYPYPETSLYRSKVNSSGGSVPGINSTQLPSLNTSA